MCFGKTIGNAVQECIVSWDLCSVGELQAKRESEAWGDLTCRYVSGEGFFLQLVFGVLEESKVA